MHLVGRCILYSYHFLDPYDSMNRSGEQMKHEATCLTKTQRREIVAKLSKPNISSKWATFDDANNEKYYDVVMLGSADEVLETMRIEEEPPIDDEIQPIETFIKSNRATDLKGFEALHNSQHRRPNVLLRCSNGS